MLKEHGQDQRSPTNAPEKKLIFLNTEINQLRAQYIGIATFTTSRTDVGLIIRAHDTSYGRFWFKPDPAPGNVNPN